MKKVPKIKLTCKGCGAVFYRSSSEVRKAKRDRRKGPFCSYTCSNKYMGAQRAQTTTSCGHLPFHAKGLCKTCYFAKHRKTNGKKIASYMRKYNKRNRLKDRARRLKRKYGITLEDYDKLLKQGGGVCWICGNPPTRRSLDVDHDHKTGKIRGLLCHMCNQGLPRFRDKPENLRRAADYLEGKINTQENSIGSN